MQQRRLADPGGPKTHVEQETALCPTTIGIIWRGSASDLICYAPWFIEHAFVKLHFHHPHSYPT
jgi:hypothetical protein